MSSRPPTARRTKVELWGRTEVALATTPKERKEIWDAVADFVLDQLLLRNKGVRIPTLGALDAVPWQTQVGDMEVTTRRPIFCLARNLVQSHNLMDDWEFQPGNLDPLQTFTVAAVLGLPRRRVEGTLQTTMSLLSRCLGTGEDVALVLRDIGVLLVERRKVRMRFYHDFLGAVAGKENLQNGIFKIQELLDMVVPRGVPVAALTSFGSIIVFPEFEREMVRAPLPRALLLQSLQNLPKETPCPKGELGPRIRKDGKGRKIGRDRKVPEAASGMSGAEEQPEEETPENWKTQERKGKESKSETELRKKEKKSEKLETKRGKKKSETELRRKEKLGKLETELERKEKLGKSETELGKKKLETELQRKEKLGMSESELGKKEKSEKSESEGMKEKPEKLEKSKRSEKSESEGMKEKPEKLEKSKKSETEGRKKSEKAPDRDHPKIPKAGQHRDRSGHRRQMRMAKTPGSRRGRGEGNREQVKKKEKSKRLCPRDPWSFQTPVIAVLSASSSSSSIPEDPDTEESLPSPARLKTMRTSNENFWPVLLASAATSLE